MLDTGVYRTAITAGHPDQRRLFTRVEGSTVRWPDGTAERVDTVILATGFRPKVSYLDSTGALAGGVPLHSRGVSTTVPSLAYVGLEWQRSLASATLRGVGRDAAYVVARLIDAASPARRRRCQPVG